MCLSRATVRSGRRTWLITIGAEAIAGNLFDGLDRGRVGNGRRAGLARACCFRRLDVLQTEQDLLLDGVDPVVALVVGLRFEQPLLVQRDDGEDVLVAVVVAAVGVRRARRLQTSVALLRVGSFGFCCCK